VKKKKKKKKKPNSNDFLGLKDIVDDSVYVTSIEKEDITLTNYSDLNKIIKLNKT